MSWQFCQIQATPEELHSRGHPAKREIWLHQWPAPAIVGGAASAATTAYATVGSGANGSLILGSAQDLSVVNSTQLKANNFSLHKRQSGGGAVLLKPKAQIWIDVTIPRDDPLWEKDIAESSLWLGEVWQQTLASFGCEAEVHCEPFSQGEWGALACYASQAPGEVLVDGGKSVGISQRRTRQGARFQTSLIQEFDIPEFVSLFHISPTDRQNLAHELNIAVKPLPFPTDSVVAQFLSSINRV